MKKVYTCTMSDFIIFYGTLTSNSNTRVHEPIQQCLTFKGKCKAPGKLYNLGRYPGLKEGEGAITAELYEIDDDTILPLLDEFEAGDDNDPDLPGFTRKRVDLIEPKLTAWAYYFDGEVDESDQVASGDWVGEHFQK